MRATLRIIPLIILLLIFSLALSAGQQRRRGGGMAGKAGDEEGEFYGGKWPDDIPKPDKVVHYMPFPAGKKYGVMPAPGHTAPSNKYAIDFAMPMRSPVCATADGWVLKAIESGPDTGGRQNSLILKHADGTVTCYLHLANKGVYPKLGEFVFRGDVVALSGASGGPQPPHLHYSRNKEQMLLCVPTVFFEGSPSSVSQNKTFDQQYEKELSEFDKIEVGVVWAAKFRIWSKAISAKKKVDGLKPKEKDHPRFKLKFKKLQETAKGLDTSIDVFVKSAQDAIKAKEYEKALEMTTIGLKELTDTKHKKIFKEIKDEIEKLPDYNDLAKSLKKFEKARKRLLRAFDKDAKGGSAKKRLKDYKSYLKSYKKTTDAAAVQARLTELENQALKETKK